MKTREAESPGRGQSFWLDADAKERHFHDSLSLKMILGPQGTLSSERLVIPSMSQCLCTSSVLSMNVLYPLFPAWQTPHCPLLQCLAKDWEATVSWSLSAINASESPPGCTPCLEMHTPDSPTSRSTGIPSCLAPRTGGTQGMSISNNWTDLQSSKNEVVRLSNTAWAAWPNAVWVSQLKDHVFTSHSLGCQPP